MCYNYPLQALSKRFALLTATVRAITLLMVLVVGKPAKNPIMLNRY